MTIIRAFEVVHRCVSTRNLICLFDFDVFVDAGRKSFRVPSDKTETFKRAPRQRQSIYVRFIINDRAPLSGVCTS